MGRGAWQAAVHGVAKESDTTEQLNNNSKSGNPGLIITPDPLRSNIEKYLLEDFPGGSMIKNPPTNARDTGSNPGSRRSPGVGNSNPLQ